MRIFTLQKKLTSFIILILLITLIIIFGVILPSIKQITELRQSINITEEFLEEQYLRTQSLQRSIRRLDEVVKQTKKYYETTVPPGNELNLITQLEKIASENKINQQLNLSFVNQEQAQAEKEKNKNEANGQAHYKFSFVNTGSFENHYNYFKTLENLPFYVKIDSIDWKRNNFNPDTPSVSDITTKFNAIIYATPL